MPNSIQKDLIPVFAGAGKGGGHTPKEASDDLFSHQRVKALVALSEGVIQEVSEIYLNKITIRNYNASWGVAYGTPNQTAIKGFKNIESPYIGGTFPSLLEKATPQEFLINADVDAVNVIMALDSLRRIKGNGDLVGHTVTVSIAKKVAGGIYGTAIERTISGKTTTPYTFDLLMRKDEAWSEASQWYIKISRVSDDDPSVKYNSVTRIAGIFNVFFTTNTYPNTALAAVHIRDADEFGGNAPDVLFFGKWRKVQIPSNYDPETRVYIGTWDLSFAGAYTYTNNPAWILYDLLNIQLKPPITAADIDKVSFYELAQYCDELIDDGNNGSIPRYTFDWQFREKEQRGAVIAKVLSICNARLTPNELGQIAVTFEKPGRTISRIFTNFDVENGMFNYASNDLETRYTSVNVTWYDNNQFGENKTITVPNETPTTLETSLLDRYGFRQFELVLQGCVHEAQAIRKARWVLYTNAVTTKIVTFKVLFQGLTLIPGEIIKVMDSENVGEVRHAVIVSSSYSAPTTTVVLDRAITLPAETITLSFTENDGTTVTDKVITESNGTFTEVSFTGTNIPLNNTSCLFAGAIIPQLLQITGVTKDNDAYVVTCVEYDEEKFNYIDGAITINAPTGDFVDFTNFTVAPVENITFEETSLSTETQVNLKLHISWDWDVTQTETIKAAFTVQWRKDNGDFVTILDVQGKSFDIDNAVPGVYVVNVWAVNKITGIRSAVTSATYNYRIAPTSSTLYAPINLYIAGTAGTTFSAPDTNISWSYNTSNDNVLTATLYDYIVEFYTLADVLKGTYAVFPESGTKNGVFTLTFSENVAIFGTPTRSFKVKVYSRDVGGMFSTALSATLSNPVPDHTNFSFTLARAINSVFLTIVPNFPDYDIAGYRVWRGANAGFTKNDAALVYDGTDTLINIPSLPATTTYYYAVAAYDTFGKTSLDISSEQSSAAINIRPDWTMQGVVFSIGTTNQLVWTSTGGTIYDGVTTFNISSGNTTWTSGTIYVYFNPDVSTTILQVTTNLATAVGYNCYPLATYTGGAATNIKGGDGSAFINGSQILAATVGASQLVTNTAVITGTAQIADAIISGAKISTATIDTLNLVNGVVADIRILPTTFGTYTMFADTGVSAFIDTYSETFVAPTPTGITGPFTTIVDTLQYLKQDFSANSTNAVWTYGAGVYLQRYTGTVWEDVSIVFGHQSETLQEPVAGASDTTNAGSTFEWALKFKYVVSLIAGDTYRFRFRFSSSNSLIGIGTVDNQARHYYSDYGVYLTILLN